MPVLLTLRSPFSLTCFLIEFLVTVDGKWSTWGSWTSCPVSCGGGSQTRHRTCTDPPPSNNGMTCEGDTSETQPCNIQQCPGNEEFTVNKEFNKNSLQTNSESFESGNKDKLLGNSFFVLPAVVVFLTFLICWTHAYTVNTLSKKTFSGDSLPTFLRVVPPILYQRTPF